MAEVKCKICNSHSEKIFSKTILGKFSADYFKCQKCGFMQTSDALWIEEAYNSAITSLDIGLLDRNISFREIVGRIIDSCFPEARCNLDYAGGYGVFVRLMRDAGYNFYRQDPYCENLFAKHFDITDISQSKFDVLTAFEVFEHFVDPITEIRKIFTFSDHVIFSTVLQPQNSSQLEDWWYVAPETGQHLSFYTTASLNELAAQFRVNYYSNTNNLHLFTPLKLNQDQIDYAFHGVDQRKKFAGLISKSLNYKIERVSLLERDFQEIRKLINS